jgi:hypothetical protein
MEVLYENAREFLHRSAAEIRDDQLRCKHKSFRKQVVNAAN